LYGYKIGSFFCKFFTECYTHLYCVVFLTQFTTKQLERLSKKAEKEQKSQENKVKKAIQQKNIDTARVYAENAVRKKNESLNYLRMAARVDAVSSRVQSALAMKDITKKMGDVTKALDKAMKSMDLEKVSKVMEKFEETFVDMDVKTSTVEGTLGDATTLSTPQNEVDALIRQVAAESDLAIEDALQDLNPTQASLRSEASASASTGKEDQLARRLAALRQ